MSGRTGSAPLAARKGGIVVPVRRGSLRAGSVEHRFWRPTSRRQARLVVLAARRFELSRRRKGRRNGPLGAVALEVLDLMANLVDFRTGRLEPSLVTLMRRLKRSRDAIVRALHNLRAHGFLDWIRRYATADDASTGPRLVQATNAYRLGLPAGSPATEAPPPLPDDWVAAAKERETMRSAWLAQLAAVERPAAILGDSALAESLSRLARHIAERESARRTGSQSG